jgi:hypothetical protein
MAFTLLGRAVGRPQQLAAAYFDISELAVDVKRVTCTRPAHCVACKTSRRWGPHVAAMRQAMAAAFDRDAAAGLLREHVVSTSA